MQARAGPVIFCAGPRGVTFLDIGNAVWKRAGFPTKWPIYNIKGEEKETRAGVEGGDVRCVVLGGLLEFYAQHFYTRWGEGGQCAFCKH